MARSTDRPQREPHRVAKFAVSPTAWQVLGLIVIAAALIRLRLLNVPFERDEGEYAYAGQLILSGVPPYTLLYNMKLPGTYVAYALSMLFFGQTIAGARIGLVLATSATCIGVFLLGRRFVPVRHALAGAAAYATLSLSASLLGPFGHATHFVALFAVWGLVALSGALERDSVSRYVAAGTLLGLAVMMKQPGAVFLGVAAVWIAAGPSTRKTRDFGAVLAGAALPFGLLGLWLLATGTLGAFWFWVIRYGQAYGTLTTLAEGWENLQLHASWIVYEAGLLLFVAGAGAALLFARLISGEARIRLGALTLFSFIGVCPGLYFRQHYFLVFVPAAALLIALASSAASSVPRVGRWLSRALIVLGCAQALYIQRNILLRAGPDDVSRMVYGSNPFVESVRIGRYLGAKTHPDDQLAIIGSEPQILFYARRRSATGFIYMYPLMERQPFAREMQERMIREVEDRRPAYAVLIRTPTTWLQRPDSEQRLLEWAPRYLAQHYALVGQVNVEEQGTQYLWDAAATSRPVGETTQALVMRRRDFVPALP